MRITLAFLLCMSLAWPMFAARSVDQDLKQTGTKLGIVALIGVPGDDAEYATKLAKSSDLIVFVQHRDAALANTIRSSAAAAGLLGSRVFVAADSYSTLHLGMNLADAVFVAETATAVPDHELLRVLRPEACAYLPDRKIIKPVPDGIDEWTHPYHGPDNNPQSNDKYVKGHFRTQFLGYPMFSPMPEQSVAAGGRIYKALGHIAHKANQNAVLSTLLCINAYNGTILWRRPLPEGFMIHRNTMIATKDALYMGDHESCKVFDGKTGEIREQLTVPADITDGPVWKWMAMRNGTLYALVGNPEVRVDVQRSNRRGLGHWPWGMWKGHDYKDPRTAFGFGRTLVAIDMKTKKVKWHYRDDEFLDARGVCMNDQGIFAYCPGKFLVYVDLKSGKRIWKSTNAELLTALGDNQKAQHYITGYSTSCYMKCTNDHLFFAGPQRSQMVVANARNGTLAWTFPRGNLQLILRDDAIWAAGPERTESGFRLDYETGKVLATFPARRACTRATGCADSIFYRASGGTVRILTESNTAQHIAPMRPPCQDGVLISNGHLYWGPWMCGCQLSLYGNIGLAPGDPPLSDVDRIYANARRTTESFKDVQPLGTRVDDWTSYRGSNARNDVSTNAIPGGIALSWKIEASSDQMLTAPVTGGGLVFVADRSGAVQAFDENGKQAWKSYVGGPVYYPPAIAHDRVFVGSADGRVYAFEAKTGRLLWSFRVAPEDRLIPVYGKLISRWPVAGGVVVKGDTIYAAAGVAHYDGTYVVALDAVSGSLKAANTTSGVVESQVNNGISMQGNLSIIDGELRFLAGGVYETARYDLKTLTCLNTPKVQVNSQFRTAFYPYYPEYGKYLSLDYTCDDGCNLSHDASYEGSRFTNLALQEPLPPGAAKPYKEAARWHVRRGGQAPKERWKDKANRRFTSFVISDHTLLTAGHPDDKPDQAFLAAMDIRNGKDIWLQSLPSCPVKGGVAVNGDGRIFASLEDGQLICFTPTSE